MQNSDWLLFSSTRPRLIEKNIIICDDFYLPGNKTDVLSLDDLNVRKRHVIVLETRSNN